MLGQIRGTSTFSRPLSSHTLIVAMNAHQLCIRAIYKDFALILSENYVAIAASAEMLQAVFFLCTKLLLCCSAIYKSFTPVILTKGCYSVWNYLRLQ